MSLINDALRRARDVQPPPVPSTPPPPPQFRPVEPAPHTRHTVGFLVPVSLVLLALLGLFFCWRLTRTEKQPTTIPVQAKSLLPETASAPKPVPPVTNSQPVKLRNAEPLARTAAPPANHAVAPSVPTASVTVTQAPAVTVATANSPTNNSENALAVVAADPQTRPLSLKLQGIIFNPQRASAVINGKPVFLGDRVGDYRVRLITRDAVTLVAPGQTNVLSLED